MLRTSTLFLAVVCATCAVAGIWEPNPAIRYELTFANESPAAATPAEDKWVASLLANLKRGGAKPQSVARYARSTATYRVNGDATNRTVFVNRDNPDTFLVGEGHSMQFVVDRKSHRIDLAVPGTATFLPRSLNFCVVVYPGGVGGIPVMGGADNPKFTEEMVSWY